MSKLDLQKKKKQKCFVGINVISDSITKLRHNSIHNEYKIQLHCTKIFKYWEIMSFVLPIAAANTRNNLISKNNN